MKKLFIVALLAFGLNGFAQNQTFTEKQIAKFTTELSLTLEQQELLKPIFDEQDVLQKEYRKKTNELIKKVNAVLTPEQLELKKELKEKEKAAKAGGAAQ